MSQASVRSTLTGGAEVGHVWGHVGGTRSSGRASPSAECTSRCSSAAMREVRVGRLVDEGGRANHEVRPAKPWQRLGIQAFPYYRKSPNYSDSGYNWRR